MCGITGVLSFSKGSTINEQIITAMSNEMKHRGPDEFSCFIDGDIAFGFRRLSIIDLANGHQPFFSNDNSLVLICNGEIYNYLELREELEGKGYRFLTNCDVEVLVHLYHEYGRNFLHRLNGQFAFAIYDKRDNSLFLARDHFGICPLFYTSTDNAFIFASEIKVILKHPGVKRYVNMRGLDQVFTFPGLVSPETMFRDVLSVPPGNYVTVKDGGVEITEYWDLIYPEDAAEKAMTEDCCMEKLEDLLLKAVKYRLNADVPIGFYLSGGLDSSLIGAIMKKLTPEVDYTSFSISFPSDNDMNEMHYQQQVIKHLGLKNVLIQFDSSEVEKRLKQAVWSAESPLKETYNTCSLALSESVNRNGLKVILSGEGADEFFGGYVGYRFDKQRKEQQHIKEIEEQFEDNYRKKMWGDENFFYEKNYYEFNSIRKTVYSQAVKERFREFSATEKLAFNKERINGRHILHKRSYVDLKLRLSDHLIADHCDRVTYANAVEGRFPFLDINLVEFIKTIPPGIKLKGLVEKYILRKLAGKYLPDAIVNRQKFGFVAPGSPPLVKKNIEWINDLLSYDRIRRQGYFDAGVIEAMKKQYGTEGFRLNLPFDSDLLIVVLTFNIFLEMFQMPDL
jgi:asparagine synthase (glutamine-hydrolysing)